MDSKTRNKIAASLRAAAKAILAGQKDKCESCGAPHGYLPEDGIAPFDRVKIGEDGLCKDCRDSEERYRNKWVSEAYGPIDGAAAADSVPSLREKAKAALGDSTAAQRLARVHDIKRPEVWHDKKMATKWLNAGRRHLANSDLKSKDKDRLQAFVDAMENLVANGF